MNPMALRPLQSAIFLQFPIPLTLPVDVLCFFVVPLCTLRLHFFYSFFQKCVMFKGK